MQFLGIAKMSRAILTALILLSVGLPCAVAAGQDNPTPKELVQYVRDARKAGLDEKQIQQNAVAAGWPSGLVTDAIASSSEKPTEKAPEKSPAPAEAPSKMPDVAAKLPPGDTKLVDSKPAETPAGVVTPVQAGIGGVATSGVATSTVGAPAPAGVKPSQPVNRGVGNDYQIGPGDVLHVSVWGEPTASVNGAVVRTDGKISLPLIHDIYILGMTPSSAEKAIAEQLGRYVNNPDVAVIVGAINSKKVYITGQVKREGTIPYSYQMRVMQALSEAGGLTPYAKKKKIYVLRNEDGQSFKLPFDYDAVLRGEHMEMNIPLKPGDQIIVP
jgi:polysaccharide export outer membrane protein